MCTYICMYIEYKSDETHNKTQVLLTNLPAICYNQEVIKPNRNTTKAGRL